MKKWYEGMGGTGCKEICTNKHEHTFEIKKETALSQWKQFLTGQEVEWKVVDNLLFFKIDKSDWEEYEIMFNPDGSLYRGEGK
jgi:hypothetical protein